MPDDLEGLVVPVGCPSKQRLCRFYQEDQLVAPEGHFPFEEVLDRAATSEQVTFVEKSLPLRNRSPSSPPRATYYETLPDAVKSDVLGLKQGPVSLHDFVPYIRNE